MRYKSYKFLTYPILLTLGLNSCQIMDELLPDKNDKGFISAKLNGEPFEVEGGKGLLSSEILKAELEATDTNFLLTIYGVRIEDDRKALAVGISLAGTTLADVQSGNEYTDWVVVDDVESTFKGAKGAVEKRISANSDENVFKASSYNTDEMTLTISEIDLENQTISGTFNFSALDSENDTLINVTEGIFDQVKWKVL